MLTNSSYSVFQSKLIIYLLVFSLYGLFFEFIFSVTVLFRLSVVLYHHHLIDSGASNQCLMPPSWIEVYNVAPYWNLINKNTLHGHICSFLSNNLSLLKQMGIFCEEIKGFQRFVWPVRRCVGR